MLAKISISDESQIKTLPRFKMLYKIKLSGGSMLAKISISDESQIKALPRFKMLYKIKKL